jgi:hypothetical protein
MCSAKKIKEGAMRKIISLLMLLLVIGMTAAVARGGRGEDCPPKSTDPDCK